MTVKFGLIGLGTHGRGAVLPSFYEEATEGVKLVAVCDNNPDNLALIDETTYTGLEKYTDYEKMIAEADIDAVYIATTMESHLMIALAAFKAGKNVVCEKPMAATVDECREMKEAAEKSGLFLAINFETRYGQKMNTLSRWIKGGYMGRIEAIHFTNMWDGHKNFGPVKERRARLMRLSGALDCGIHEFDQARYLLGGKWDSVRAVGAWLEDDSVPPSHIGIIGTLDNGVMVTLNASLTFAASIKPRPMLDNVYIVGTEGVAIINTDVLSQHTKAELYSKTLCENVEFTGHGHASDIALLLTDFAKVVANGVDTEHKFASGEDGYQATLATEYANSDAVEHRKVRF